MGDLCKAFGAEFAAEPSLSGGRFSVIGRVSLARIKRPELGPEDAKMAQLALTQSGSPHTVIAGSAGGGGEWETWWGGVVGCVGGRCGFGSRAR